MKILSFTNEDDSDSDCGTNKISYLNEVNLFGEAKEEARRRQRVYETNEATNLNLLSSERLKTSLNNCATWLQLNTPATDMQMQNTKQAVAKKVNLPDLSQPPPPLLNANYNISGICGQPPLPPAPPVSSPSRLAKQPRHISPDANKSLNYINEVSSTSDSKNLQRERERDRSRRGLPNIRDKHVCSKILLFILYKLICLFDPIIFLVCSKTLWLGHLAKTTTEDYVIDELTELLSPSSSNDSDTRRNRSAAKSNNKNGQGIIVDCQVRIV